MSADLDVSFLFQDKGGDLVVSRDEERQLATDLGAPEASNVELVEGIFQAAMAARRSEQAEVEASVVGPATVVDTKEVKRKTPKADPDYTPEERTALSLQVMIMERRVFWISPKDPRGARKFPIERIREIRFSQMKISPTTSDGVLLETIAREFDIKKFSKKGGLEVIMMPDGRITSFNNRRLYALRLLWERRAGASSSEVFDIPIVCKKFDEIASNGAVKRVVFSSRKISNKEPVDALAPYYIREWRSPLFPSGILKGLNTCAAPMALRISTAVVGVEVTEENCYGFDALPVVLPRRREAGPPIIHKI